MFHREGYKIILITTIAIGISFIFIDKFVVDESLNRGLSIAILLVYLLVLQQFRNSKRTINQNSNALLSPVDGKIISIEEGEQTKMTFKVSPFNFHIVRAPFDGTVIATNASNEFLIEIENGTNINLKTSLQLNPGSFSQNPVLYPKKNSTVVQGEEIGFIKFDGRVTMIVPGNSKLEVKINDRVKAGEHIIAKI